MHALPGLEYAHMPTPDQDATHSDSNCRGLQLSYHLPQQDTGAAHVLLLKESERRAARE